MQKRHSFEAVVPCQWSAIPCQVVREKAAKIFTCKNWIAYSLFCMTKIIWIHLPLLCRFSPWLSLLIMSLKCIISCIKFNLIIFTPCTVTEDVKRVNSRPPNRLQIIIAQYRGGSSRAECLHHTALSGSPSCWSETFPSSTERRWFWVGRTLGILFSHNRPW